MRWELLPHKSVKRLLIHLELQSSCNVTVHCSVPNTAHCISGEKTATPPPFYLPSLTANDPVVKKRQQKKIKSFAVLLPLCSCFKLAEVLLLDGIASCCSEWLQPLFPGPFSSENPSVFLGEFKLSSLSIKLAAFFFNYTVFHTAQPRLSHSHYQPFSPHTLLLSRATVNSHACGNDGFCTVVKHSSG